MSVGLTPRDARKLKQIDKLSAATMQGIRLANHNIGTHLRKLARRKIIEPPKSGAIYHWRFPPESSTGPIRRHQASAPGQPPANFTGRLKDSVDFIVKGQQLHFGAGGPILAGRWKGFEVFYARALELGRRGAGLASTGRGTAVRVGGLAKRPYLKPSIVESAKVAQNYYRQYIGENIVATVQREGMRIRVKL